MAPSWKQFSPSFGHPDAPQVAEERWIEMPSSAIMQSIENQGPSLPEPSQHVPSPSEKVRRKRIVQAIEDRRRAAEIALMPISQDQLAALFDHLDEELSAGCDHSLKLTQAFLKEHALDVDAIVPWLGQYGGYCDCEVLSNVEEVWGQ